MKEKSNTKTGVTFLELLALLFIALKLLGFIQWSWLWVLSPLWLPITIVLVIVLIRFIMAAVACLIEAVIDDD